MTPQSPSLHQRAPRAAGHRRARRTAVLVAAVLAAVAVPLVAQALDDDPAEPPTPTLSAAALTDIVAEVGASVGASVGARVDAEPQGDDVDDADTAADATNATNATNAEAAEAEAAAAAADAAALEAIVTVLTDTYAWDERGPRIEFLQGLLGVHVNGRYVDATHRAHVLALLAAELPTTGVPALPPSPSPEQWAALRDCESGGDYSISSSSGTYRGAYQFGRPTWDSVAGRHAPALVGVDPAAASPADQDAMALALYRERGPQPWPVCGRQLR